MENRRKHQRFRAAIAAELEHDAEQYSGVTRDLSQTGASIFVEGPVIEDAELTLTLFLTEDGIATPDSEPLTIQAKVVWVAERKHNGVLAGLHFIKPSPQDNQRLALLLAAFTSTRPG
jgi:c-di-GMP-binding flagellar brake protein YcgR